MLRHQLTFILAVLVSSDALAAEQVSEEVALVARMYRAFASEVVVSEPKAVAPGFIDQPAEVLGQYLAPQLVSLLRADRGCVARRGEICNLDFDPIWASQDPAATDLKVRPGKTADQVEVTFLYPGTSKRIQLRFDVAKTPAGRRIRDIHYSEGPSLVALLQRAR